MFCSSSTLPSKQQTGEFMRVFTVTKTVYCWCQWHNFYGEVLESTHFLQTALEHSC